MLNNTSLIIKLLYLKLLRLTVTIIFISSNVDLGVALAEDFAMALDIGSVVDSSVGLTVDSIVSLFVDSAVDFAVILDIILVVDSVIDLIVASTVSVSLAMILWVMTNAARPTNKIACVAFIAASL